MRFNIWRDYPQAKLTELLDFIVDNRGKSVPTVSIEEACNHVLIATNCIRNERLYPSYDKIRYISQETYESWFRSHPIAGDIIFVNKGTPGRVCLCPENIDFCIAQDMMAFRTKSEKLYNKYLLAVLRSREIQEQIRTTSVGDTIPHFKKEFLKELYIPTPPLDIQRLIGNFYFAFSNKIELNNRINENLELQAQAIFKSWFVDFEPFGGVMPEDWKIKKVKDIPLLVTDYVANGSFASLKANVSLYQEKNYAYFIRNTDLKSGTFNVYVDEHSYKFLSKSVLYGGEIIISNVGDVGSVFLCPKLNLPMTLGNNIIMLRPENEIYQYFLYIWFKWMQGQAYIQSIKSGSAQPKFNKTDFKNTPMLIPNENILKKFHTLIKGIFKLIETNISENQRLVSLRDTLLPKLMNGEIDVSEVKI